jgi:hypothetical protein
MARGAVEHEKQVMISICFTEVLQERLQTKAVHARQV